MTLKLSLRVCLLFIIAILFSFIPEMFRGIFGDWACTGAKLYYDGNHRIIDGCLYTQTIHDPGYHWGYRHWLYFFMGLSLAIIQFINIVNLINKKISSAHEGIAIIGKNHISERCKPRH